MATKSVCMSVVLSVKNLRKIYPGNKAKAAVDSISFEMKESEILGLLGPNGSGKTTTIQMLLGTLSVTSGSIAYFGKDFFLSRHEILQSVSFASAYTSLPWTLTVAENLKIFGRLYGMNPKESSRRFEPLLERFGISDMKDSQVTSLSAGQITRLMITKAFFIGPKIVLLDEPTASLDPDIADEICEFILEERDKTGLSILFTSHKTEEASELCDRVIFLKDGKIIADDLPKNLASLASPFHLRLVITDGMERAIGLAQKHSLQYTIDHNAIIFAIQESKIPQFITDLSLASITYASIRIEEPSLEDYFLYIARSKQ